MSGTRARRRAGPKTRNQKPEAPLGQPFWFLVSSFWSLVLGFGFCVTERRGTRARRRAGQCSPALCAGVLGSENLWPRRRPRQPFRSRHLIHDTVVLVAAAYAAAHPFPLKPRAERGAGLSKRAFARLPASLLRDNTSRYHSGWYRYHSRRCLIHSGWYSPPLGVVPDTTPGGFDATRGGSRHHSVWLSTPLRVDLDTTRGGFDTARGGSRCHSEWFSMPLGVVPDAARSGFDATRSGSRYRSEWFSIPLGVVWMPLGVISIPLGVVWIPLGVISIPLGVAQRPSNFPIDLPAKNSLCI